MIKAVLFDFDGTLIDTNELIFTSYKKAFKAVLNREIEMDEILTLYGRPLYSSLMEYGEAGEKLYLAYRDFNEREHDNYAKAFEGAVAGVEALKKNGYKTGIVTSKRLELVERGLRLIKLDNSFDVLITPADTERAKPNPEPVLCGCEKLGVLPSETIYVGDSEFDLIAGRKAGTRICAVKYSVTPFEKLMLFEPEYMVGSIMELASALGEIS